MYTHGKDEHMLLTNTGVASTGLKGRWAPGFKPVIVRAAGVIVTNTLATSAALVVSLRKQNAGSTATADRTVIDTITVPASRAAGKGQYVDGLNQEILPGEEVQMVVTTAAGATGDAAHGIIYVEPRQEEPGNLTNLTESA